MQGRSFAFHQTQRTLLGIHFNYHRFPSDIDAAVATRRVDTHTVVMTNEIIVSKDRKWYERRELR